MAEIAGGTRRPTRKGAIRVWESPPGKRHRSSGPAMEFDSGAKTWFKNGEATRSEVLGLDRTIVCYKWYEVRSDK